LYKSYREEAGQERKKVKQGDECLLTISIWVIKKRFFKVVNDDPALENVMSSMPDVFAMYDNSCPCQHILKG